MLSFAYLKTNNFAEAEKVLEPMMTSEFVPKSELPTRVKQLLTINYQLKNYDKVIQFADTAQKGGYADEEIQTLVGQAYYLKGDYKKSTAIMDGIIQNIAKSGRKPKEQTLVLVQNACTKSGDNNCLQRTYEQLVTYYPKPIYWQNLVDAMYKTQAAATGGNNDKNMLQVYRLAAAVDVLKKSSDYTEYAQLALERGAPGEAQAVLEKGFANKIFVEKRDVDRNQRLLESAKKAAAADPSSLAQKATTTGTASDPDVSMGLAYLRLVAVRQGGRGHQPLARQEPAEPGRPPDAGHRGAARRPQGRSPQGVQGGEGRPDPGAPGESLDAALAGLKRRVERSPRSPGGSEESPLSRPAPGGFLLLEQLFELGNDREQVAHQPVVRDLENRRLRILVDRDDRPRILDAASGAGSLRDPDTRCTAPAR